MHFYSAAHERLDKQGGRRGVVLRGRDQVGDGSVGGAARNLPCADLVDAQQELLAILRRDLQHPERAGQHVVHRVGETDRATKPGARVTGRRLGHRHAVVELAGKALWIVGERRRRWVPGLGEDADDVVEVRGGPNGPVVPGGELIARHHARFALALEAVEHRAAHQVDPSDDLRVDVRVERVGKRRHEHPRRRPPRLVLVVHDLGQPLLVEQRVDDAGLGLRLHVRVAVVVVADVLLVQPRHRAVLVRRVQVLAVPVDDHVHAVGVHRGQQDQDHVVADLAHLRRFVRGDAMRQQERMLRRGDLAGMQAVVDPHDGLAFARQRAGGIRTHPAHVSEPLADVAVVIGLRKIGFGRNEGHQHVVALGGLARRGHGDTIRRRVQLPEVVLELPEVRELVVVTRREPQDVFRRGNRLLCDRRRRPAQDQCDDDQGQDDTAHAGSVDRVP